MRGVMAGATVRTLPLPIGRLDCPGKVAARIDAARCGASERTAGAAGAGRHLCRNRRDRFPGPRCRQSEHDRAGADPEAEDQREEAQGRRAGHSAGSWPGKAWAVLSQVAAPVRSMTT